MKLGYDKKEIEFMVEDSRLLGVLLPNEVDIDLTDEAEVIRALDNPIGSPTIDKIVKKGQKVCIITSDITRPMPSSVALPPLLERLNQAGIPDSDIFVVFSLGSHREHTIEEMIYLVGESVYNRVRCIDSDVKKCAHIGYTSYGTCVDVFDEVVNADVIICMGNIEYHYFAGYSGGAKAIMPGVSTNEAIKQNHSMMVHQDAYAGNINSPVRLDIEEVASKLIKIDFILNVVLDEHKKIIKAVAGHYIDAHRVGCEFLDSLYKINLDKKADIVVVSSGGYPKDINMYQAQKALDNAKHAVADTGIIIWVASCKEGLGSATFEKWMSGYTPDEMIVNIKKDFKLGGHKAAAVALVLKNSRIFLVSDLDPQLVKSIHLEPYASLEEAYSAATSIKGADSCVYVMPYGGSTLPSLK